jgi:hypothetical protein
MRLAPSRCTAHTDEYCFGRMVTKIGLITIGSMTSVRAARARIKKMTQSCPGEYIVFHRKTGRVVVKTA